MSSISPTPPKPNFCNRAVYLNRPTSHHFILLGDHRDDERFCNALYGNGGYIVTQASSPNQNCLNPNVTSGRSVGIAGVGIAG
jgi:hypothetical protein